MKLFQNNQIKFDTYKLVHLIIQIPIILYVICT